MQFIKKSFFSTPLEKKLQNLNFNHSMSWLQKKQIKSILQLLETDKTQLMKILMRQLFSKQITMRFKVLLIIHTRIKQTFDPDFIEIIENLSLKSQIQKKQDLIILDKVEKQYILYIKKLCSFKESYQFVKAYNDQKVGQKITDSDTKNSTPPESEQNLPQLISNGFQTLNAMNTLLQFQQTFKKSGRYCNNHGQVFSIYLEILRDMSVFNIYIKKSVAKIIENFKPKEQLRVVRNLKISLGLQNASKEVIEEMKQKFLYIYEAQATSDKLYEFYHNKYYYPLLERMIVFPSFLTINEKEYKGIVQIMKKIDKKFVCTLDNLKYLDSFETDACKSMMKNDIFLYEQNTPLSFKSPQMKRNKLKTVLHVRKLLEQIQLEDVKV